MKILLVDDEMEFVSALAERLSLRGIEADWVIRPEDAIQRVAETCYDMVVLDVKMPRINGIALKGELERKCPNLKFIFLTGHGAGEDFTAGMAETGVECYLAKPLRIETLLAVIKRVTAERKEGNG